MGKNDHDIYSYYTMRRDIVLIYKYIASIFALIPSIWITFKSDPDFIWYEVSLSIVPTLLTCAVAIFIGCMCMNVGEFYKSFCIYKENISPFICIMSEITSYFMVYIIAIVLAFSRRSGIFNNSIFNFLGLYFTCLSITTLISYILVFRLMLRLIDIYINKKIS